MDHNDAADSALRTYLRRLSWALASLPKKDREDIVEETREHVLARVDQGQPERDVLAALGPAEIYARSFIEEMELSGALAGQRPMQALAVVLTRVHRSVTASLTFLALLVLAALAFSGLALLVTKPLDPEHVGLWVSPNGDLFLGVSKSLSGRHEILGMWVYPLAILDVALSWFAARLILLGAVRRLASRS